MAPGTNAAPKEPKSASNAATSAVSASVQFLESPRTAAEFLGFVFIAFTLCSVTPVEVLDPPATPPVCSLITPPSLNCG